MSGEPSVVRGDQSWTFLYVLVGFLLAIEGTMVSMIEPLRWWQRELLFIGMAGATFWLILINAWVQDRVLGWKSRYEKRAR